MGPADSSDPSVVDPLHSLRPQHWHAGLRLVKGNARLQSRHGGEPEVLRFIPSSRGGWYGDRVHCDGHENIGLITVEQTAEPLFSDADDNKRIGVDGVLLANHPQVAPKSPLPVAIRKDRNGGPSRSAIV